MFDLDSGGVDNQSIILKLLNPLPFTATVGNSIIISLSNGEGWLLHSETNDFKIEKNIFFGNKNKITSNDSVSISGNTSDEIISIKWEIERIS